MTTPNRQTIRRVLSNAIDVADEVLRTRRGRDRIRSIIELEPEAKNLHALMIDGVNPVGEELKMLVSATLQLEYARKSYDSASQARWSNVVSALLPLVRDDLAHMLELEASAS